MTRLPGPSARIPASLPIRAGLAAFLACASAAAAASADGARGKRILSLGTLGGAYSQARGINEAGVVVGESHLADGEIHAFYWSPRERRMVDLGTLGGRVSRAYDINNRGLAVGTSQASAEEDCDRAVVWNTHWSRPPLVLPDLDPDEPFACSYPQAINDAGVIAGNSAGRPVRWVGGRIEVLDLPTGLTFCVATAINERGWITLFCDGGGVVSAYLWKEGAVTLLGATGSGLMPTGVNGQGQVVGYGPDDAGVFRAFAWRRGALSRLAGFGSHTDAWAISENGLIAGSATIGDRNRAVIWDRRGVATELGTLPGGTFSRATAVNDAGVVAGLSSLDRGDPEINGYEAVIWQTGGGGCRR